jgi:dihydroorotate dehydrogenase (fumarate)
MLNNTRFLERVKIMVDLTTTYLGLKLKNPLVASASPLSEKVDILRRIEEAGLAGVVMYSLFEEQIIRESLALHQSLEEGTYSYAEALTYLPELGRYSIGPEKYVAHLQRAKKALNIPVIGSLNGYTNGGWIDYARKIEQAGADALELNIYFLATNPDVTALEIEDNYVRLVHDIRQKIQIPIAVKLGPFFTALPNLARRLVDAGADGLVLFNRFYQPDFDLDELEVVPNLVLSTSQEMRLPLRWIAMLYGRIQADFALTTGVHTAEDAIKAIMAGSSVAMMTSALLKHGPEYASSVLIELQSWMEEREYESVTQMKGSMSQQAVADPSAFARSNYIRVLSSYILSS